MFPLQSGLREVDQDLLTSQSYIAAAMHEIGKQSILDSSLLLFHQQAADVCYRESEKVPIEEDSVGNYKLYSPEEYEALRKEFINIVMKYHIFSPDGMAARLTPLINYFTNGEELSQDAANDPFIQKVIASHRNYTGNIFNQNMHDTMLQILDFNMDTVSDQMVIDSYTDDNVDFAIYEDDTVQCVCAFCERFFNNLYIDNNREQLNPIQQVMADNYNF